MSAISFDTIEQSTFGALKLDISAKLSVFNESFKSSMKPENGFYQSVDVDIDHNIASWLNANSPEKITPIRQSTFAITKAMYNGVEQNEIKTRGLRDISKMKINLDFREQNIRQQSGFAAEVISTAKENLQAKIDGSDVVTYRADDLPDLFSKNDQYVDKVRINSKGDIVERVQTKFVGGNAAENFSKLMSPNFDKYFNEGKVDKIEIPSNYYDEIKTTLIPEKVAKLERQLERVTAEGKVEVAEGIQAKLERCKKIDSMLEKSTVSSDEARYARLHPKRYAAKLFVKDVVTAGHNAGVQSGLAAATLTLAMSTVENVKGYMNGDITAQEAFIDVAKDTGTAGGIGYGTAFLGTTVARGMSSSGHTLIRSLGKANLPAAVISFGIDSYDSIIDYAHGEIDGKELAVDLGESAVGTVGAMSGAAVGAATGSIVPVVGTVVGGLVGGMVGYAVATGAYATAIEVAQGGTEILVDKAEGIAEFATEAYAVVSEVTVERAQVVGAIAVNVASAAADTFEVASTAAVKNVDALKGKAIEMGKGVLDLVASTTPKAVDSIRTAMNEFASNLGVLFNL